MKDEELLWNNNPSQFLGYTFSKPWFQGSFKIDSIYSLKRKENFFGKHILILRLWLFLIGQYYNWDPSLLHTLYIDS